MPVRGVRVLERERDEAEHGFMHPDEEPLAAGTGDLEAVDRRVACVLDAAEARIDERARQQRRRLEVAAREASAAAAAWAC